jgi:hypothetical protein
MIMARRFDVVPSAEKLRRRIARTLARLRILMHGPSETIV